MSIIDFNKVWDLKKKHKYLEVQSDWMNGWTKIISFDIDWCYNDCDHPGWTFTFELAKLWFFQITYYDSRHWDMIVEDNAKEANAASKSS